MNKLRTYFVSWIDCKNNHIGNLVMSTVLRGHALVRYAIDKAKELSSDAVVLNIIDVT